MTAPDDSLRKLGELIPAVDDGLGNSAHLLDLGDGRALAVDPSLDLPALDAATVRGLLAEGGIVLDVRPVADYAAGHIPGSMSIPLRAQFATWLGWLVPPDIPIAVVRNPDQDPADIAWPALAIGYHTIVGELAGGTTAWEAAGGSLTTTPLASPSQVDTPVVLDVRQANEHVTGHLPGAALVELGSLTRRVDELPAEAITVMCGHGERAATGASLLERAGRTDVSILDGGLAGWQVFARTSLRDRALSPASQAGLVNNLNDGLASPPVRQSAGEGITADLLGLRGAVWIVAALTAASGVLVAVRTYETRSVTPVEV